MKRFLPVVLIVLLLGAVGFYLFRDTLLSPKDSRSTEPDVKLSPAEEDASIIGSIQDAMTLGEKLKCTYSAQAGSGTSSTIFIDGQKFKSVTDVNGEKMYGLFDGETQYTWTTGTQKQGFKMTKACMEELAKTAPQTTANNNGGNTTPQDLQKSFDAAQNVSCEAATGEDFSVPTDIVFADQCEMIRNSMKALEDIKGQLPDGVSIPGY